MKSSLRSRFPVVERWRQMLRAAHEWFRAAHRPGAMSLEPIPIRADRPAVPPRRRRFHGE